MTRILVVAPSWVGDALLSQPLLTLLKQRDPGSTIDVLGPGWALPIFLRMPEVSETIESPFAHGELALSKRLQIGRDLAFEGLGVQHRVRHGSIIAVRCPEAKSGRVR